MNLAGAGWRVFAVAFSLNLPWEMGQMFTYAGMSQTSFRSVAMCSAAAVGDGVFALVVYWAGSLISGNPKWIFRMTPGRLVLNCGSWFRGCRHYGKSRTLRFALAVFRLHAADSGDRGRIVPCFAADDTAIGDILHRSLFTT